MKFGKGAQRAAAFVLLLVPAVLPLAAHAATDFTLEQVLGSPFPQGLTASVHSTRVAWVFNLKGARNVWVADGPAFAARQVTHYSSDDGLPIASLRLTPDGRTVVYVLGTEINNAGRAADPTGALEPRKQTVWAMDADGAAPRLLGTLNSTKENGEDLEISPDGRFVLWSDGHQLWSAPISGATPAVRMTELRGDNIEPRWSPDGNKITFVSDRGDHSIIVIYKIGDRSVSYLAPTSNRDVLPRWSPDGRKIAFIRLSGLKQKVLAIPDAAVTWSIWIADSVSGDVHQIWQSGDRLDDSFPILTAHVSFSFPSNDKILFDSEQDGRTHLYSVSPEGGKPVLLTAGDFDVEDVNLSADGKSVIYSSNQADVDRRHLWRVSLSGGSQQALTAGDTLEWSPVETGEGHYLVCLGSAATTPAMPYRVTRGGREMLAGDALPKDFPSKSLVVPKQVIFRSEDGLEVHGQLFSPANAAKPTPAVIFMHGGPPRQMLLGFHYIDYYHNAYAMNQYLASRGYTVLSVNYRRGIMYGRAFREPPNVGSRGASEYRDIVAAAKFLQSLPGVDGKKIGLWGGSYGGYLTALGLARNSDLFAAGVDLHGVHDWSLLIEHWLEDLKAPDAEQARKLAFDSSPNASLAQWKSPVLLIHGDDDRNVKVSQSVDLAARLRENNVAFRELIIPDEIHDFLLWKTWMRVYQATSEFFDETLKKGGLAPVAH